MTAEGPDPAHPPLRLGETIVWRSAIAEWQRGNCQPLARLLRETPSPPKFARKFLALMAEGKADRNPGRPAKVKRDTFITLEFDLLKKDGATSVSAMRSLAAKHNISVDAIKKVVRKGKNLP